MGEWEYEVSRIIVERYLRKLLNALKCEVLIAGAGPSGLVAAYYLARSDVRVTIVEQELAPGGSVWGGGMERNEVVVQEAAKAALEEMEISVEPESNGFYGVDSVLLASALSLKALREGATMLNLVTVEDVMIEDHRLTGLVVNSTGVVWSQMHVEPITLSSRVVIDGTGHPAAVTAMVQNHGGRLETTTGKVMGRGPMQAENAEQFMVSHTGEIYPGLYAMGRAVSAIHGGPRTGPIFGGMILSGKKAAEQVLAELKRE